MSGQKSPANAAGSGRAVLPQISEETLIRMLDTQSAKIALEMKHAEIALREVDHNQKLADKSIEAQSEDRKDQRKLALAIHRQRAILIGVGAIALLLFVVLAMYWNKDQLAHDIVKLLVGLLGGYGIRAATEKKSSAKARSDSDD